MKRNCQFPALALTLACGLILCDQALAANSAVKIGQIIDNLTFKDIHYLPRSLDDFPGKKAFVLVFTTTACPLVQQYLPTLKNLDKEYRDKGVQFLAVNVGLEDSMVAVASQAVAYEMEFPFVKDYAGRCVQALGVDRTPAVVVLDERRGLRYRGRIDDQYRLGGARAQATRAELKEALDALLGGGDIKVKETPVDGCLITLPKAPPPETGITYSEHVASILQKHCQECHRPNTAAPFSLVTYKQVAAKADMIAEVVGEERMPPWYGSSDFGHFVNRRGLSAQERETILAWVRSGMPKGDDSRLTKPPQPKGESKWLIGKPDLILSTLQTDTLPVSGDIPYKYTFLPYVFTEETWVQGVQILPDNPRVVHHCNMAYVTAKEGFKESNFITGTVPGGSPMLLDGGVAFRIPKGATLVLQIHYVSTGKPEKCRISVGFKYAKETVQKQLRHVLLVDHQFAIPPGAPAHPVSASKVLDRDAVGIGLFVHMHLRGRDMMFKAHRPDGKSETLLLVPNYSFDWQIPYVFEPGKVRFPKGTRLEAIAHYDNSAFNPYNPDPDATVRDGQQTRDEMLNGFVFYTDANERLDLDISPETGRARAKAPPGS
jgi:thiol-disulfide isomerase/thioredoxin